MGNFFYHTDVYPPLMAGIGLSTSDFNSATLMVINYVDTHKDSNLALFIAIQIARNINPFSTG